MKIRLFVWPKKALWVLALMTVAIAGCQSESFDHISPSTEQVQQLYAAPPTEVMGNPQGTIVLVSIGSYECHYCREDYPVIKQFVAKHPDIKWLSKTYLAFGLDTQVEAQYAVLAAAKQHQFAAMNEALYTTEKALNETTLADLAKQLKLNQNQWLKDRQSEAVRDQIVANTALVDQLGIPGIPTVIMSHSDVLKKPSLPQYLQVGFINQETLEAMYEEVAKK